MHDIGRTQLESSGFEAGALGEFGETFEFGEAGGFGEYGQAGAAPSPLREEEETELAAEFVEITNEQELDRFLGNVFRKVGSAAGRFVRSDTGRALGGILRGAAKQALPVIGRGIGQWISPARGGDIGADVGTLAGRIFGLELEGLSAEDREFEVARQFVRFAGAAVRGAADAPPTQPAITAARQAVSQAAQTYAPGLFTRLQGRSSLLWPRTGRWVRRGRTIVLYGG